MHRQKILRHPQSHCQESYKNIKLHNCKVYAEDLAQTHKKTVFCLFSLCEPYEPCLFESMCCVFMMCSTLPTHTTFPSRLLWGSASSSQCLAVGLWHLLPSISRWHLSDGTLPGSNLRVQQHVIAGSFRHVLLFCLGSQVGPLIGRPL